jgi:hypothetical protein
MVNKSTYEELEHKTEKLEMEVLNHVHKEIEFSKKQKFIDNSHLRRAISLLKINEELNSEILDLKRAGKEELEVASNKVRERIKELNCIYGISRLKSGMNLSMNHVLQAVVEFIPPAIQSLETTCARILLNRNEFTTKNFKETKWKFSQEIKVNNERIGVLEVCHLKEKPELEDKQFLEESKKLITVIAENIAQIVEREWAEIEIINGRNKIEELIKQN